MTSRRHCESCAPGLPCAAHPPVVDIEADEQLPPAQRRDAVREKDELKAPTRLPPREVRRG